MNKSKFLNCKTTKSGEFAKNGKKLIRKFFNICLKQADAPDYEYCAQASKKGGKL